MLHRRRVPLRKYAHTRAATTRGLGNFKYFGAQDVGSYFGGQTKDLSLGSAMLSNNEKTLIAVGVIGIVGWFAFGPKIKKALR